VTLLGVDGHSEQVIANSPELGTLFAILGAHTLNGNNALDDLWAADLGALELGSALQQSVFAFNANHSRFTFATVAGHCGWIWILVDIESKLFFQGSFQGVEGIKSCAAKSRVV
jgi:hypothetical protein